MYCKYCGFAADSDALFCSKCGAQIQPDNSEYPRASSENGKEQEQGERDVEAIRPADSENEAVNPHPRWEGMPSKEISVLLSKKERELWQAGGAPDLREWDGKEIEPWLASKKEEQVVQEATINDVNKLSESIAVEEARNTPAPSPSNPPPPPFRAPAEKQPRPSTAKVSNGASLQSVWWVPLVAAFVSGLNTVVNGAGFGTTSSFLGFILDTSANTAVYALITMGVSAFFQSRAIDEDKKYRWAERFRGSIIWAIIGGSITLAGILLLLFIAF